MYTHTLSSAARATGIAKSRIRRAIKAGRLTAYELGTGDYAINPVELRRAFPSTSSHLRHPTSIRASPCGTWGEEFSQMETRTCGPSERKTLPKREHSTRRQMSGSNSRSTLRSWNGKEPIIIAVARRRSLNAWARATAPLVTVPPTNYCSRRRCCIESRASCDAHRRPTPTGNPTR
jgi:hypothetical protein